jgi:hypothetical protein
VRRGHNCDTGGAKLIDIDQARCGRGGHLSARNTNRCLPR